MKNSNFVKYCNLLSSTLSKLNEEKIDQALSTIVNARSKGKTVYLAGNGGSAGNAIHLANDYLFGATNPSGVAVKVSALPANTSVITCLGNDIGYENIFAHQISVLGESEDVLILLSGSGNSSNIIKSIQAAKEKEMITIGILGFAGGKALNQLDIAIHAEVNDMQISEDVQMVVGHYIMQQLCKI